MLLYYLIKHICFGSCKRTKLATTLFKNDLSLKQQFKVHLNVQILSLLDEIINVKFVKLISRISYCHSEKKGTIFSKTLSVKRILIFLYGISPKTNTYITAKVNSY